MKWLYIRGAATVWLQILARADEVFFFLVTFSGKIHKIYIKPNAQAQAALIKLHQLRERASCP